MISIMFRRQFDTQEHRLCNGLLSGRSKYYLEEGPVSALAFEGRYHTSIKIRKIGFLNGLLEHQVDESFEHSAVQQRHIAQLLREFRKCLRSDLIQNRLHIASHHFKWIRDCLSRHRPGRGLLPTYILSLRETWRRYIGQGHSLPALCPRITNCGRHLIPTVVPLVACQARFLIPHMWSQ